MPILFLLPRHKLSQQVKPEVSIIHVKNKRSLHQKFYACPQNQVFYRLLKCRGQTECRNSFVIVPSRFVTFCVFIPDLITAHVFLVKIVRSQAFVTFTCSLLGLHTLKYHSYHFYSHFLSFLSIFQCSLKMLLTINHQDITMNTKNLQRV